MKARKAAFLDRDGTLIDDVGYLSRVNQVRFLPGAVEAVRILNEAGFFVALVTNQSGVARGYFSEETVEATHRAIQQELALQGARIDAFYYCPHFPEGAVARYALRCDCRKPLPGMFHRAERDHGPFAKPSFMFGDRQSDMDFATAAGLEPRLVGAAAQSESRDIMRFQTLLDAARHAVDL
jgi:D-glycero-D-manno-heptose 1,7-bisphosphate phosphatase